MAFVPRRRQQALAEALRQFEPEAERGAHSRFRIEGALVGQGEQAAQVVAKGGGLAGLLPQARRFLAYPLFGIVGNGRAQPVRQRLEAGDGRVDGRVVCLRAVRAVRHAAHAGIAIVAPVAGRAWPCAFRAGRAIAVPPLFVPGGMPTCPPPALRR